MVLAPLALTASQGVWKDALLEIRGMRDANGNGMFDANPGNDNYASATVEIPDARHAAVANPQSARIWYNATHGTTQSALSEARIVKADVVSAAWGNKTFRDEQVLEFPSGQYVNASGENSVYCQRLALFGNVKQITGDQYTYIARVRVDGYVYPKTSEKASGWLFHADGTEGAKALRFGFRTHTRGTVDAGFVNIATGNVTNNELTDLVVTNGVWAEVAYVVNGRTIRASIGVPGCIRRWKNLTVPTGNNYPTSLTPSTPLYLGGCRDGEQQGNADCFRGAVHLVGVWNRALSDAEVVEAFGGPNPNLLRIGEEDCAAEMFAGATATGEVTLDQTESDQRLWPAAIGAGAVLKMPFTVGKYVAGLGQVLRILPRAGSGAGRFAVAIDDRKVAVMAVRARTPEGDRDPSFLFVPSKFLTEGDHVLTLTRMDARSEVVKLDTIELGGSWRVGLDNGAREAEFSSDTQTSAISPARDADTWYPASQNLKDFVSYSGRKNGLDRQKRIIWRIPDGLAGKAVYKIGFKGLWSTDDGIQHVLSLNGTQIDKSLLAGGKAVSCTPDPQTLVDGFNELLCNYPDWVSGKGPWTVYDSFWCEITDCVSDRVPPGLIVSFR